MIIELIGLPGSGKSTLASQLAAECNAETNRSRPLPVWAPVVGAVRFPALFVHLLLQTLRQVKGGGFGYVLRNFVFSRIAELGRAWQRQNVACQVLDEGPLQAFLSVSRRPRTTEELRSVVRLSPADRVVLFDIAEPERQQRLLGRTYKLRPYLTDTQRLEWERTVLENFTVLKDVLRADSRVMVVHNSNDADRVVHELATHCTRS